MQLVRKIALSATAAALALTFGASRVSAQGVFGAFELDDDNTQLLLLGAAFSPGGSLGWKPFGTVVGYNLRFDAGATTESRNVLVPTVGLMRTSNTQSLGLGVGYAMSDEDTDVALLVPAQSGDGVVASLGWDYWGTGNRMAQLLASYNFGTEYVWTRGRAATQLATNGPLFVGGEAALMGGQTGDGGSGAFLGQFGPLLEYRFNPQFRLTGSAGLKVGIAEVSGTSTYGRIEFLWLPGAR